jgi:hypothetical protein
MGEDRISDEQAQRIWRRAAELQVAAAERAEQRRRTLGGVREADGLSVGDVREAAVQAGIGEDFVVAAIAELESERDHARRPGRMLARSADKLLDHPPRMLHVTREIPAEPRSVFASMKRICPHPPFGLLLRDTRGGDLFVDGVLVFEVGAGPGLAFSRKLAAIDATRLFVTLRGTRDEPSRCDVTVRAPTGRLGLNVLLSGGLTAAGGGSGAAAGAAVGPALAAVVSAGGLFYAAVVGAAAIVTGVAAGGLVLSGYRALFDRAVDRANDAIESLIQAVAVDIRTHGVFSPRPRELAGGGIEPD